MPNCYTGAQCWNLCVTWYHTFVAVIAVAALVLISLTYREVRKLRKLLEYKRERSREWIAKLEAKK
jgi:hypothetical protein